MNELRSRADMQRLASRRRLDLRVALTAVALQGLEGTAFAQPVVTPPATARPDNAEDCSRNTVHLNQIAAERNLSKSDAFFTANVAAGGATTASVLEQEVQRVDVALREITCVEMYGEPGDVTWAITAYEKAIRRQAWARQVWVDRDVYEASVAAQHARNDARTAKNLDDARAAAKRATDAATKARRARDRSPSDYATKIEAIAEGYASEATEEVALREHAPDTICGADGNGRQKHWCGTYGIFAASLSYVGIWTSAFDVTTRSHLAAIGVPSAAVRYVPGNLGWFSLELGGYSAFLTKSLTSTSPSASKTPCARTATDYDTRLPCEASADAYPYLGGYAGATVGRSGVGFLTLAPLTFGITQVGSRSTLRPYAGFMLGVLQVNGSF